MTESSKLPVAASDVQELGKPAPMYIGLPVFMLVLILLGYAVYWGNLWLQDEQRLPVQQVIFSGEMVNLSTETLERIVREQAKGSFFALDVNHVHKVMENEPWVFSASVRKRWPSKLYIHIIEQTAVARWNEDLLLNKYGETFDGKLTRSNNNADAVEHNDAVQLPDLYGPGGSEKTVLTGYTHMQRLLNTSRLKIEHLVLSERFAWQARLSNNMILKLGRQEYINRLQRFIDVYPLINEQSTPVEYVDLRYDTGVAVGWLQATADNNNS